jgi:uncharacterized membrane protein YgcG
MAKRIWKLRDEQAEQILTGRYSGDDAALSDLSGIARDVKATLMASPDDATRATHLVAIGDAAANLDVKRAPASTPVASPRPLRRVKVVLTSLLASLVGKIALVSVAVAATTGGLAATGSLPDAAQDALARASEKVGFELPAGDGSEDKTSDKEAQVPDELPEATEGSSAQSVLDVIRSWDDDKGCEFGHAVATAAGGDPGPCKDEEGDDDGSKNDDTPKGKPEDTPKGKPEGAGKPEGTPQGKPAGAGEGQGKPEGTPDGKPEGAGKPEGTPGGGSNNAGDGSGNADSGGKGSNGSGDAEPPSDLPVGGGNGSSGGPPDSVPSGRP